MKTIILLIFLLINFENSIVPNWNFEKSTKEIFPSSDTSKDYPIYESNYGYNNIDHNYKLVKRLTRDSSGKIVSQNILTINNEGEKTVPYENIDSAMVDKLGKNNLVCPRGRYHPTDPNDGSIAKPTGFEEKGEDWDLHCFEHYNPYYIYIYSLL